jgi:alkanesulfonate monooxygenase SsuD/methylene tetrahydromethanopterin reductase-like flavin-dependent oxidoreductase (luciferase family)
MAAWADRNGFDQISLSEHHGSDDGYDPSPIVFASALAARTARVRLRLTILLLALYDPVKAAEDLAVLDIISSGRLDVVAGGGYRAEEFAMFGRSLSDRPKLIEEHVRVLTEAWTGEPFEYRGTRMRVKPMPMQKPCIPLWLGGSSAVAARRAARLPVAGFYPTDPGLESVYQDERRRLGLPPGGFERMSGPLFIHVATDPDRDWAAIAPHALHETNSYAAWSGVNYAASTDAAHLRSSGSYRVVTPDECVQLYSQADAAGSTAFRLHPLMGGMDPAVGWSSLELFVAQVLPRVRAATA